MTWQTSPHGFYYLPLLFSQNQDTTSEWKLQVHFTIYFRSPILLRGVVKTQKIRALPTKNPTNAAADFLLLLKCIKKVVELQQKSFWNT